MNPNCIQPKVFFFPVRGENTDKDKACVAVPLAMEHAVEYSITFATALQGPLPLELGREAHGLRLLSSH